MVWSRQIIIERKRERNLEGRNIDNDDDDDDDD
jgi:hypothetical protein